MYRNTMYFYILAVWVTHLTLILGQFWTAKVQRGVRCTDVFHSSITSTELQCFHNCLKTFKCCSVNYIEKQNVCEFCKADADIKIVKAVSYKYIGYTINMNHRNSDHANQTQCYACAEYFYNMQFTVNTTKDGDVKTFKCNDNAEAETEVTEATCQYSNNQWSLTKLTCREKCFDKAELNYFNEKISTLIDGQKCEMWDSHNRRHYYADFQFIADGKSRVAAQNYCRHPSLDMYDVFVQTLFPPFLYCVPKASLTDFAMCAVPSCDSTSLEQCGPPPFLPPPVVRSYPLVGDVYLANYKCSNFSGAISIPHCPVSRCIGNNNWTTPSVSCSLRECYPAGKPRLYAGKRTCTESGKTCQAWAADYLRDYTHQLKDDPTNENFCRSETDDSPWCYTTDTAVTREYCSIPEC